MIEPVYNRTDYNGNELSDEELEYLKENAWHAEPFTKTNWKTASSRDEWSELLQEAAHAKQVAEWRSVMDGSTERKAAIIHVDNNNREKWIRRVGEYNLHYRDIRYSKPYNGYSHKFLPTDENDLERITYSVIAENPDIADKMEEAELEMGGEERHRTVGELLGFPDCCLDHFADVWLGDDRKIDPMYEASCNTGCAEAIDGNRNHVYIPDQNPWTNSMYRYFGWSFITHLPCSWDCEKSEEIAKSRGSIMDENGYTDAANALYKWLYKPMTWTGYKSLAHIRNEHMIGSAGTSCYWNEKKIVWNDEHPQGGSIV
jgi:hypothetical protein